MYIKTLLFCFTSDKRIRFNGKQLNSKHLFFMTCIHLFRGTFWGLLNSEGFVVVFGHFPF